MCMSRIGSIWCALRNIYGADFQVSKRIGMFLTCGWIYLNFDGRIKTCFHSRPSLAFFLDSYESGSSHLLLILVLDNSGAKLVNISSCFSVFVATIYLTCFFESKKRQILLLAYIAWLPTTVLIVAKITETWLILLKLLPFQGFPIFS